MFLVISEATTRRLIVSLVLTPLIMLALGVLDEARQQSGAPVPTAVLPEAATPTPMPMLTFQAPTSAPTVDASIELAPYPVYGPAADFRGEVWLNTDAPLHLADLRGEVTLILFWAFRCPPCFPVLDNARAWHEAYGEQGLTVVGVHTPNIEIERDYDALVEALERLDVPYPVLQDNDRRTWHSYGQTIWPTVLLVDKRGYLRYQRIGEGGYDEIEAALLALLAEES